MSTKSPTSKPKIIATNHLESTPFELQITFDKFGQRDLYANDSCVFSAPGKSHLQFFLRLHANHLENIVLELHFVRSGTTKKKVIVHSKVSLLDQNGEKWNDFGLGFNNGNQDNLGSDYFFKKHTLNNCLVDNKLSICCEVTYITTSTKAEQGSNAPESNHFEKMANNFVKLRKNGNFSDIVLVVRGKEFRAHKFLLCAQSPVFEAMFLHDTKEKQENRVQITDMDSNVFEKLLDFIYSGKSDCVKGCEDQLLAAADKYGLENLKNACENALCVKLTPASVPDLLVLADTYNASKLKQKALDYLQTHGQDTIQAMFANNQADQLISAFRNMAIPGGSNQSSNRGGTGQGINNRNIKPILKR